MSNHSDQRSSKFSRQKGQSRENREHQHALFDQAAFADSLRYKTIEQVLDVYMQMMMRDKRLAVRRERGRIEAERVER